MSVPGSDPPLAIPARSAPIGPVTATIQRRWVRGYLALWAVCLLVVARRKSVGTRAAATGLMVPGGGFLYTRRIGRLALSVTAVLVGFVAWFLLGMMFAPFLVWAVTAALAARGATRRRRRRPAATRPAGRPDWALIAAVSAGPAILAANGWLRRLGFRRDQRRLGQRNEQLAAEEYVPPTPNTAWSGCAELTAQQLAFQRYILDRALQPLDRFDGFEWFDQFREAAVRYQLNYAQWALALAQYRCTPAFHGYLTEAQRRLIEKMTARSVWEYWRWENLWGNFRADPDPIRRDNIMLSGYYGVMLGTYASLTGDLRYDEPGCLEFRWNRRKQYRYDAPSIARIVHENMRRTGTACFPANRTGCTPSAT